MGFPPVTPADWRALVDQELAGKSFEKALVHEALEGIRIAPLYTEAPPESRIPISLGAGMFRICMRHETGATYEAIAADVEAGADAVWMSLADAPDGMFERKELAGTFAIFDVDEPETAVSRLRNRTAPDEKAGFALRCDPLAKRLAGEASFTTLPHDLALLGRGAQSIAERFPGATSVMVSSLPYHDAGADAADELAFTLATGVRYLDALLDAGLSIEQAAAQLAVQVAVGCDTFIELCKLRALRVCWHKLLAASGVGEPPRLLVHAVCSFRTLTVRDPWVNMLRVTTQVFAAVLGGANLITPNAFDQAFGSPSAQGRRVARNTGLVLREESALGRVIDPAAGSYYFDTLTDALARQAWQRFAAIEREGGITAALLSGRLKARLEAVWHERLDRIAKRKIPILGVSEFAHLQETLPRPAPDCAARATEGALPVHRDAAAFERLRARSEAMARPLKVLLIPLGSFAESRPRVGFAVGFFAAGGLVTRESESDETADIACLCGTDERYAAEAEARARALKAAGCARVLLAGRPKALENALRKAGVDGFIHVGCDVVATLSELLELRS
jgi:methylmalonyl-CoA mutase